MLVGKAGMDSGTGSGAGSVPERRGRGGLVLRLTGRLAFLVVLAGGSGAFGQELHKDERIGFQLRAPRGWKEIPVPGDEAWMVGKYRAPKPERALDPTTGYTEEHFPELIIVALVERPAEKEPAKDEPAETGEAGDDEEDDEETESIFTKTYRDYREYLKDHYPHGHFIEKEEAGKHGDLTVTRFEIKAERDVYFTEKRILTWVYETDIGQVAVQVEVMAESLKKLQPSILDALKSFKTIPRTQALEAPLANEFLSFLDLGKLTPAERRDKKLQLQRAEWDRTCRDLPEGWRASEIDGVFVLNHADDRYARKVVEHVRAIYAWLGETFPEIGPHEHARLPIVRICKDQDEEFAFRSGTRMWGMSAMHIVTHKGTRADSWEWEYIGGRALSIWFMERAPELWFALPAWLNAGLDEVVSASRIQGGKLVFEMGDLEKYNRDYLPRGDEETMSVRALIGLTDKELAAFEERDDRKTWCQAVALTRYFVGARSKKTRELLVSYLGNLSRVLAELEEEEKKGAGARAAPKNEEEEEKLFQEREKWLESRERAILDRTIHLTFPAWTAGDWRGLDREFRRTL